MSSSKRPFVIPFIGLKIGSHDYHFEIDQTFFDEQNYVGIDDAGVAVHLVLEKKETMLIAHFILTGWIQAPCDRCMDPLKFDLNDEYQIIYKFGHEESDDENLVVIHPDSYEIDVKENIYELIMVSMPAKLIHEEGECNEEMMQAVEKYTVNLHDEDDDYEDDDDDEDDGQSPWDILKNLN